MSDFLGSVAVDRLVGERPSVPRAVGAAVVVGTVCAVATYRLLRR